MDENARFWAKVEKTDTCWLWLSELSHNGYGRFTVRRERKRKIRVPAHRWSLLLAGVEVPSGMEVDHLCKTRNCVRMDHLEVVTQIENNRRSDSVAGRNSRKTHCVREHDLSDPKILYVTPNGRRQCRICRRMAVSAHRARTA